MEEQPPTPAGIDVNQYLLNPPRVRRQLPKLPSLRMSRVALPAPSPKVVTWVSLAVCAVLVVILLAPLPRNEPARNTSETAASVTDSDEASGAPAPKSAVETAPAPTLPRRVDVVPPARTPASTTNAPAASTGARTAPRRAATSAAPATPAPAPAPSSTQAPSAPTPRPSASTSTAPPASGDAAALKPLS